MSGTMLVVDIEEGDDAVTDELFDGNRGPLHFQSRCADHAWCRVELQRFHQLLDRKAPLERLGVASSCRGEAPQTAAQPVKGEPQETADAAPLTLTIPGQKRKARSSDEAPGKTLKKVKTDHGVTQCDPLLVPLLRDHAESVRAALQQGPGPRSSSWWEAVSTAAEHLAEAAGESPCGQLVVVSSKVPQLEQDLTRSRLPEAVRLHQLITRAAPGPGSRAAEAVAALEELTTRTDGSLHFVPDREALQGALDEILHSHLVPTRTQVAVGHLRTDTQCYPRLSPSVLRRVGLPPAAPTVLSVVGFLPLAHAPAPPVLCKHHLAAASAPIPGGFLGGGAELYSCLHSSLLSERMAAVVRLSAAAFGLLTAMQNAKSKPVTNCLVLTVLDPRRPLPWLGTPSSLRLYREHTGQAAALAQEAAVSSKRACNQGKLVVPVMPSPVPMARTSYNPHPVLEPKQAISMPSCPEALREDHAKLTRGKPKDIAEAGEKAIGTALAFHWPQRLTAAMDILATQQTTDAAKMRLSLSEVAVTLSPPSGSGS